MDYRMEVVLPNSELVRAGTGMLPNPKSRSQPPLGMSDRGGRSDCEGVGYGATEPHWYSLCALDTAPFTLVWILTSSKGPKPACNTLLEVVKKAFLEHF